MKIINKNFRNILIKYINLGIISIEIGSKHMKIRSLSTFDWIPVAGSPSDRRAKKNFEVDLDRLVNHGKGFIYDKTGHLPIRG